MHQAATRSTALIGLQLSGLIKTRRSVCALKSVTALTNKRVGSASQSYCDSNAKALGGKPATMAAKNFQQYNRVGIRNMSGEPTEDIEVFGKAATGTGNPSQVRGDCPFSQRIYLELEEKSIPYKATYIQEGDDKPDWFMEKNPSGLMPALRDGEKWIQDSDKIAQHLEERFPDPSLKTPAEFKNVGENIFQCFTQYLQSKKPDDSSKGELLKELKALDEHLKQHGPFIAGDKPTDSDFALIPKLKHLRVSLAHYMDFHIPAEFSATHKYIEMLENRPSFKRTDVPDKMIIEGWQKKFSLPDRIAQPQTA
ncbi:glutathione dehydrogenase/transferase [Marchantia polymorpha subsp. ruderalis]|uniref:Dehydroascorbate reductase n=2 Tax=Marchantia polymorpha TaxID=3197 RepID=A0AAF6AZ00_MARPO|nr:hypothetical protein MARPO_0085s0095 [Marchantia polymorpha]BBN04984.1 hypothetical protein Mp_3g09320 [Marchantia polymorpha subsp. ruderalis]|eukprot:PTQ33892.1 hypothetical protein MARPO_0085s0095 [Marchantia polymorpha]